MHAASLTAAAAREEGPEKWSHAPNRKPHIQATDVSYHRMLIGI